MMKILAVASEGGHWKQLNRLNKLLLNYDVCFVSTNSSLKSANGHSVHVLPDANKNKKLKMMFLFLKAFVLFLKVNPDVIISTGAAPGLSMIFWGSVFGKKTIWIDSIANSSELSLSGKIAKKYATVVLSQWPEVAEKENVLFRGMIVR